MADDNDKIKYQGTGVAASAIGQSQVDGVIGTIGGGVVGGAVGATLLHSAEKQKAARTAITSFATEALDKVEGMGNFTSREGIIDAVKQAAENAKMPEGKQVTSALKTAWRATPRLGKAAIAAVTGAAVLGVVSPVVGFFRGANKAQKGQEQFTQLSTENAQLTARLEGANQQLSHANQQLEERSRFAEKILAERAGHHHGHDHGHHSR